jgi:tetratricopeptide (TPR) repeat protein
VARPHDQNIPAEEAPQASRKISLSALTVLLLSVVLFLGGSGISGFLSKAMKTQNAEVRPSFQTTMNLAVAAWQKNPVLGIGPNRFSEFWAANKPAEINSSQFWNADFYFGSGFIPTAAITTGLLGLLSLLVFIGMYLTSGVKAIFAQANSNSSRYLSVSSFLVSLYLWIMLFVYTPGITVLALAFIFTGLFTATLVPQGTIGVWKVNIFSNPKTNFLSVLSIVILLMLAAAGGYFVWERAASSVVFQNGVLQFQTTGNTEIAEQSIAKAISMVPSDAYWRSLTEIYLLELGKVLDGITNQNQVTDAVKAQAQTLIASSIESGKKAVELDGGNFQNWFALSRVYEILAQNGIQGTLENARSTYAEAARRSPSNPSVPLALGRLDALSGNTDAARQNINKALALKSNFTDAYYTLAQVEVAANKIPEAIKSVEAATVIDPTNSGLYFQLGLLKYNQKDFAGAAAALEKAVTIVPDYANAKYFLGISYYQIGKKDNAIAQFESLAKTNADNEEVAFVLAQMQAGKSLFPEVSKTQSKTEPPVKEN